MRLSGQVVRVALTGEPEPYPACQIALIDLKVSQYCPDPGLMPCLPIVGHCSFRLQYNLYRAEDLPQQMSYHVGNRGPGRTVRHELARVPEEGRRPRADLGKQAPSDELLARRQPRAATAGIFAVSSA